MFLTSDLKCPSSGSCLGHSAQLAVLFGATVEALGDEAQLEEDGSRSLGRGL